MKYTKLQTFYPDTITLLFSALTLLFSLQIKATENPDYIRYEKIFSSHELESTTGKKLKLNMFTSEFIIVNFWASWCIPCLQEIPSLIEMTKKASSKKLTVVMINTDEDDQLKNIIKIKNKLSFPEEFIIIPDKKFKLADEFKFSAIPVTVIYKKGKVVYFNNGPVDFLKFPLDMR